MSEQLEFAWDAAAEDAGPPALKLGQAPRPGVAPQETAERLLQELSHGTGMRLHLSITNNTSTMMSLRMNPEGGVRVRLHHMFLGAPPEVRAALRDWIRKPRGRKAADMLDAFIRANQDRIRPAARRAARLRTEGQHHDLQARARQINAFYFGGRITAPVTWGRMPASRRRRSIRFGSYSPREHLIRIHPLLDQPFVPEFFIDYILFHEMLHADLGIEETPTGRRRVHTPEFKRREAQYPDYARAVAWMETAANLNRLLRRQSSRPA